MTGIEAALFILGFVIALFGGIGLYNTRNFGRGPEQTLSMITFLVGFALAIATVAVWSMRSQRNDHVATCSYNLKELGRDKRDTLIILQQGVCYDMKDSVLQILAADLGQTQ